MKRSRKGRVTVVPRTMSSSSSSSSSSPSGDGGRDGVIAFATVSSHRQLCSNITRIEVCVLRLCFTHILYSRKVRMKTFMNFTIFTRAFFTQFFVWRACNRAQPTFPIDNLQKTFL